MHRVAVLALASLLVGCDDEEAAPDVPPPPSGPSVPALATAWTTAAPPEPWLVVAYHDVSLGDGPPIVTLEDRRVRAADKQGGATGFLVSALHQRLASVPAPAHPQGVAIDPEIPFRTVSEVVYTLGQAERHELVFIVRSGDAVGALPVAIPRIGRAREGETMILGTLGGDDGAFADVLRGGVVTHDAEDLLAEAEGVGVASSAGARPATDRVIEPTDRAPTTSPASGTLNLSVIVTARGISVAGSGGFLAPGCEEIASGAIAVPLRAGLHDLAALTSCLERVHREFPEEDTVIVSAHPDIAFRDVAGAMAAARGTEASPLFPRVLISAAVR